MIDFNASPNFSLIAFERALPKSLLRGVTLLSFVVSVLAVLASLAEWLVPSLDIPLMPRLAYFSLAAFALSLPLTSFSMFGLRNHGKTLSQAAPSHILSADHVASFLDFESALILAPFTEQPSIDALALMRRFLGIKRFWFVWTRLGLDRRALSSHLAERIEGKLLHTDLLLVQAARDAIAKRHTRILPHDIFTSAYALSPELAKSLFDLGIQEEDVRGCLEWEVLVTSEREAESRFWDLAQLRHGRGLGKFIAFGFTPTLEEFSQDITASFEHSNTHLHLIGHRADIDAIEATLARRGENNALVFGEPGVGRHTTVFGFAQRIIRGNVDRKLLYKRILQLDTEKVLSGLTTPGAVQERLDRILYEAKTAGNIILVVDGFENFTAPSEKVGAADVSQIFMKYMASPNFQLVAISDSAGFHKHIEPNGALMKLFERIEIEEASPQQTLTILEYSAPQLEKRYGCFLLFQSLRRAIDLSDFVAPDMPFPERALEALESALASAAAKKLFLVTPKDMEEILTERTGVPLDTAESEGERLKLLNLERLMHERLIDQEEAVTAIAESLRRTRTGLTKKNRPIGTFLFLGPTGVGKTETARSLAAIYFGLEESMIRLDMSEFQGTDAANRLIGTRGEGGESPFLNAVRERPFALVLLDEMEKAHPSVLNLFLQVLDEGRLTDASGRRVSFVNTIIIATSNAGADFIREEIRAGRAAVDLKNDLVDLTIKQKIFRPEFLNRFDAVVVFKPLAEKEMAQIAELMLKDLGNRLKTQGYQLKTTKALVDYLVKQGFDPVFGARAMRRTLNEKVEGVIAKRILTKEYRRGSIISLKPEELE